MAVYLASLIFQTLFPDAVSIYQKYNVVYASCTWSNLIKSWLQLKMHFLATDGMFEIILRFHEIVAFKNTNKETHKQHKCLLAIGQIMIFI